MMQQSLLFLVLQEIHVNESHTGVYTVVSCSTKSTNLLISEDFYIIIG